MPEMMYTQKSTIVIAAPRRKLLLCGLLGALLLGSSACVYRVPIQQGNFLEAKDVDQVTVGMTPVQVRYVLGTPVVIDPFTKDRWDYVYYLKRGQMRKPEERHFIVYFANGAVSRIERVEMPKG
jgi:outer membrane protein assembly factor BamE